MKTPQSKPVWVAWLLVLSLFGALFVAGCGSSSDDSSSDEVTSIGKTEGAVNLIAWAGYAEDGSTDKAYDWVTPFQDKTGCQVSTKTASTSDEMVKLMRTGQYDGVSASGDASVRLMEGGDVEAIDMSILSNYADINPDLKDQPYNSKDGMNYGMPHGWGANVLLYNTDVVKPAPTSWSSVFDEKEAAKYSGKITAPDNPIYIADAAVYLKATQPDLGIDNPYELTEDQFNAAVDLLKAQNKNIGEYWPDATKNISSYTNGDSVIGSSWQYQTNTLQADGQPADATLPDEGSTGWSDTWMLSSEAANPNCMLEWMNWMASPDTQAQVAEWFGEAPANLKACDVSAAAKSNCEAYHAEDKAYFNKIAFWQTPISDCGDGEGSDCKTYDDWVQAWTEIKG